MKTISDRIKEKRTELRLSQRGLADKVGVTSVAVSRWELDYSSPKGKNLMNLAKVLKCTPSWLLTGKEAVDIEFEGIKYVLVPFYNNVGVAAGCGCFNEDHEAVEKIPIPFYILDSCKVNFNKVVCVKVKGDSMEPVLKSGSIIAVDTSATDIIDGDLYVICHEDLLRVKLLYRYPDGVKLRSYNNYYKEEMYKKDELSLMRVVGKVFWASVFF